MILILCEYIWSIPVTSVTSLDQSKNQDQTGKDPLLVLDFFEIVRPDWTGPSNSTVAAVAFCLISLISPLLSQFWKGSKGTWIEGNVFATISL